MPSINIFSGMIFVCYCVRWNMTMFGSIGSASSKSRNIMESHHYLGSKSNIGSHVKKNIYFMFCVFI